LADQKNLDEIDISVHCDILIFDWLMKYVHGQNPVLDVKNSISILISSDFLQISPLVECTINFISNHLQDILMLPIDMNCMSSDLVKKLAHVVDLEVLENVSDRKDKLRSKLFMKRLELMFEDKANTLHRCVLCNTLFNKDQFKW